jgi:hypothetical protein
VSGKLRSWAWLMLVHWRNPDFFSFTRATASAISDFAFSREKGVSRSGSAACLI